jgi:hypothetical protein
MSCLHCRRPALRDRFSNHPAKVDSPCPRPTTVSERPDSDSLQGISGADAFASVALSNLLRSRRDDRWIPRTSMGRSTTGCFRRAGLRLHGVLRRFPFLHFGSVMPNYAAHRRTGDRMMSRHVSDNPAYRGALYTTMSVGDDGKCGDGNRQQQLSHVQFPLATDHAPNWCPCLSSPGTLLPCTTRTRWDDESCSFPMKGPLVRVAAQSCFAIGPATTLCSGVRQRAAHPALAWQRRRLALRGPSVARP